MKVITVLLFLTFTGFVFSQTIEKILPTTNYYSWKSANFSSPTSGFVLSEQKKVLETKNGGVSWTESKIKELAPSKKELPKKIRLIGMCKSNGYEDFFVPMDVLDDSLFIGRSIMYNPYLIKSNGDGTKWNILNGITINPLTTSIINKEKIMIADSYGHIFVSNDSAKTFKISKEAIRNENESYGMYGTRLGFSNEFIYSYDDNNTIEITKNFGITWNTKFTISQKYQIRKLIFTDSVSGLFISNNGAFHFNRDIVSPESVFSVDKDDRLLNLHYSEKNTVIVSKQGKVYIKKKKKWDLKPVCDDCKFNNGSSLKSGVLVLTTAKRTVFITTDFKEFEELKLPPGYFAFKSEVYENHIIFAVSLIEKWGTDYILTYDLNSKSFSSPKKINKGPYVSSIVNLNDNYILGNLGSLHRLKFNKQ